MKFIDTLEGMKSKRAMSEYFGRWFDCRIASLPKIYRQGSIGYDSAIKILNTTNKNGIFLTGRTGCGKTTIATQLLRLVWEKKVDGLFVEYQDWMLKLGDSRKEMWSRIKDVKEFDGLLVLDDIGFEKPKDFVKHTLYTIVNYRVSNDLPLVLTSNIFLEELDSVYDMRLVSRIEQHCEKIEPSTRDYRIPGDDNE